MEVGEFVLRVYKLRALKAHRPVLGIILSARNENSSTFQF